MLNERKATAVERFFTRSPFSIVTMVARIKGEVTKKMLRNAVEKVQQRHYLLRVRVREDHDHAQWFTPDGVGEIPVEVVERKSQNDWIEVHAAVLKQPFEFETRPAIRFILVQAPDVSELIILCHHTICDGMSLAYLAKDLLACLGEPVREVEVSPVPPAIDLDNLPDDVSQSGLAKFFIKRMNKKWAEQAEYFDQEDYVVLTQAYWDNFHHQVLAIELSEAETSALVDRCRAEQVTVNSALTAAFCGAQSFVEGEQPYHKKIVVAASLRDRLPKSPGEGMGMYAGGIELDFKYDLQRSFWENVRAIHKTVSPKYTNKQLFKDVLNWLYLDPTLFEAMNFKKLGGLIPADAARYDTLVAFSKQADVVSSILERDQLLSLETKHWGTAITNLGRLDFPKHYGELELERLIMQPGGGIPLANANLVLGAITAANKLSLVLEYAAEAVELGVMQQVEEKAMVYLAE